MRRINFFLDSFQLLYDKFQKINFKCGQSYEECPEWMKNKYYLQINSNNFKQFQAVSKDFKCLIKYSYGLHNSYNMDNSYGKVKAYKKTKKLFLYFFSVYKNAKGTKRETDLKEKHYIKLDVDNVVPGSFESK